MKAIWFAAILVASLSAPVFAGPSTQPHDQWHSVEYGELMLRDFKNAPFPHPSRAKGYRDFGPEHYQDSTIGIVIPKTFKPSDSVDLIVHFHGFHNYVENVLDKYQLPDQLIASGCNAILIVPQGPKDAADAGFGKLEDAGGFERLIKEIVEYLHDEKKIPTTNIGRIVLTTHSGGYKVTSLILQRGGLRDHITDTLLFDSSYGELEGFADWIKLGHDRRLVSIFTAHLAPANFELLTDLKDRGVPYELTMERDLKPELLKKRTAIFIHTEDLPHDEIMTQRKYYTLFLKTSALGG
jgi:hypothetical protein